MSFSISAFPPSGREQYCDPSLRPASWSHLQVVPSTKYSCSGCNIQLLLCPTAKPSPLSPPNFHIFHALDCYFFLLCGNCSGNTAVLSFDIMITISININIKDIYIYIYKRNIAAKIFFSILPSWLFQVTPLVSPSTTSNTCFQPSLSKPLPCHIIQSNVISPLHNQEHPRHPNLRSSHKPFCLLSPPWPPIGLQNSFQHPQRQLSAPTSKPAVTTNYPEETIWGRMVMQRAGSSTPKRGKRCSCCPLPASFFFRTLHTQDWEFDLHIARDLHLAQLQLSTSKWKHCK